MNHYLIELDENEGLKIDGNGEITSINKAGNEHEFEEILRREDELEKLNTEYAKVNETLSYNKAKRIPAIIYDVITYFGTGILCGTVFAGVPIVPALVGGACFFGFGKIMGIGMCGSRRKREKEREQVLQRKLEIEKDIPELKEELEKIKDKVKYKEENKCIDHQIEYSYPASISRGNQSRIKVKNLREHK